MSVSDIQIVTCDTYTDISLSCHSYFAYQNGSQNVACPASRNCKGGGNWGVREGDIARVCLNGSSGGGRREEEGGGGTAFF